MVCALKHLQKFKDLTYNSGMQGMSFDISYQAQCQSKACPEVDYAGDKHNLNTGLTEGKGETEIVTPNSDSHVHVYVTQLRKLARTLLVPMTGTELDRLFQSLCRPYPTNSMGIHCHRGNLVCGWTY